MSGDGVDAPLWSEIRIGTSGWSYKDWVGPFYPDGTSAAKFLTAYALHFDSVEVDSTFYAVPSARTFEGWRDRTPEDFRFALKVPGIVTHGAEGERARVERVLVDPESRLEGFLGRALLLGRKLACVLFQFPYFRVRELSLSDFLPRLEATLARIPEEIRVAVEVRNKGWIRRDYLALLRSHRAAAVLLDHVYMPPPREQLTLGMVTTDFAYVRLIGDRYAIEEKTSRWDRVVEDRGSRLDGWSEVIEEVASRPALRCVFAFSNNHYAGHAPATCRDLAGRLGIELGPGKASS